MTLLHISPVKGKGTVRTYGNQIPLFKMKVHLRKETQSGDECQYFPCRTNAEQYTKDARGTPFARSVLTNARDQGGLRSCQKSIIDCVH